MEEGLLEENLKLGEKRDLAGQGEGEQQQKQDKVEWRVMKANGLNQGKNTEVRGGEESVPTGNTGLSVTSEPLFLFFSRLTGLLLPLIQFDPIISTLDYTIRTIFVSDPWALMWGNQAIFFLMAKQ